MKKEMNTQKIIITGSATRIGAAIAEDLANDKIKILEQQNQRLAFYLEEERADYSSQKSEYEKV